MEIREHTSRGREPRGFPSGAAVRVAGREHRSPLSPQLCCLHADLLGSLGPKEAKKAFLDFYHSFLEKTAVRHLRGPVPSATHPRPAEGDGKDSLGREPLGQPGPPPAAPPQTTIPRGT